MLFDYFVDLIVDRQYYFVVDLEKYFEDSGFGPTLESELDSLVEIENYSLADFFLVDL